MFTDALVHRNLLLSADGGVELFSLVVFALASLTKVAPSLACLLSGWDIAEPYCHFQCSDVSVGPDGAEPQKIGFKGIITLPKPVQFKSSVKECHQVTQHYHITDKKQNSISAARSGWHFTFSASNHPPSPGLFLPPAPFRMFPSWRPLCSRCVSSSYAAALWCCACRRTAPRSARQPSVSSRCGSSTLRRRSTGWSSTHRPNHR